MDGQTYPMEEKPCNKKVTINKLKVKFNLLCTINIKLPIIKGQFVFLTYFIVFESFFKHISYLDF